MPIKLEKSNGNSNLNIMKIFVHDENNTYLFTLEYNASNDDIEFYQEPDEYTDSLIKAKSTFTDKTGIEAYGSYISGANQTIPHYTYFLSLYFKSQHKHGEFDKYHITINTNLEHMGWQNNLFLSIECYAILFDALQEYSKNKILELTSYPRIKSFFSRNYSCSIFQKLIDSIDESTISKSIKDKKIKLDQLVKQNNDKIESMGVYFVSVSGAVMASHQFGNKDTTQDVLSLMTHSTVTSPGNFTRNETSISWFPFNKNKVGKINRMISTTLDAFTYASPNNNMNGQIQNNIAHKFHELVDILCATGDEVSSYGIETNVGYLVCLIRFKKQVSSDTNVQLEITKVISTSVKEYGQAILTHIAKNKNFEPLM